MTSDAQEVLGGTFPRMTACVFNTFGAAGGKEVRHKININIYTKIASGCLRKSPSVIHIEEDPFYTNQNEKIKLNDIHWHECILVDKALPLHSGCQYCN